MFKVGDTVSVSARVVGVHSQSHPSGTRSDGSAAVVGEEVPADSVVLEVDGGAGVQRLVLPADVLAPG